MAAKTVIKNSNKSVTSAKKAVSVEIPDTDDDNVEYVDFAASTSDKKNRATSARSKISRKKPKKLESELTDTEVNENTWEGFFYSCICEELADDEGPLDDDGDEYYWRFTIYPEDVDNFEELRGLTTVDIVTDGDKYHFSAH